QRNCDLEDPWADNASEMRRFGSQVLRLALRSVACAQTDRRVSRESCTACSLTARLSHCHKRIGSPECRASPHPGDQRRSAEDGYRWCSVHVERTGPYKGFERLL